MHEYNTFFSTQREKKISIEIIVSDEDYPQIMKSSFCQSI